MAQPQTLQPSSLQPNIEAPSAESLAISLRSLHNFAEVAALVNSSRILPPQFVMPETDRPGLAHDAFRPEFDLPVFDLSLFAACQTQEERNRLTAEISAACKECGFFQIVNHGLEPEIMQKMDSMGRSFFEMPTSTKEKVAGYKGEFDPSRSYSGRWVEAVNWGSARESFQSGFIDMVWSDASNKEFSACMEKYIEFMEQVTHTILGLLIESLNVNPSAVIQDFGKGNSGVRYNYYPPCPQPSLTMGLGAHTDPCALTVLFQDDVGGLQLRGKDGKWRAVKPTADAFVVNVGDTLKVLSNGVYQSAEHRAVLNSSKARLSLGFFFSPGLDYTVKPLEELVDAKHPPHFKPFNYLEYVKYRISAKNGNINAYAGMPH